LDYIFEAYFINIKMQNKKAFWVELAIVAVILLLGAYVRLTHLTCLPGGLYPDEAMNTTDGLKAAEAGQWPLFYENNNGREGLYISVLGYLLYWFGNSLWMVRFLPALIGTLTLPAVYWIGRRASGKFGGIMALGLIAFSYWHLNFSRVGFRALLMVFMLSWAFAFLTEAFWRLVNSQKKPCWLFAVSGLFFGLSLHTYIAMRIAPAAVAVFFILMLIFYWNRWKEILKYAVITVVFTLLSAAPILYDFIQTPFHFTGRTGNVSLLSTPNFLPILAKNIGLTLASFLAYGDQNWRHNFPYLPLVLPFWGIAALVGVGWGIGVFFKEIAKKIRGKGLKDKKRTWEIVIWITLIAWWGFLLLPSIMTNEGLPHALRSIGAIPPTFLLAGLIISKWAKTAKSKTIWASLMVISGIFSVYAYFFLWGQNSNAYGAFDFRTSGIGIYLRDTMLQDPKTNYYFITNQDSFLTDNGTPVMVEPVRFFTWQYRDRLPMILPGDFDVNQLKPPAKVFMQLDNADIINQIQGKFPNAELRKVKVGGQADNRLSDPILFSPANEECFLRSPVPMNDYFSFLEIK